MKIKSNEGVGGERKHSKVFKLQEMLSLGPVQVFGEDLNQFLFSSKCLRTLREYSLPRELLENHIFPLTKGSANEPWYQKLEVKPVTGANPIPMFVPPKGFFFLYKDFKRLCRTCIFSDPSYFQMKVPLSCYTACNEEKINSLCFSFKALTHWSCSFKTYFLKTFTARNVLLIQNIKKRNRGRGRISE